HIWNMRDAAKTEQFPPDQGPVGGLPRPGSNMAPRLRPLEGDRAQVRYALSLADATERAGPDGIALARTRAPRTSTAPYLPADLIRPGAGARASARSDDGGGRCFGSDGMSTIPGRWRRIAMVLAEHASSVLPRARLAPSPWADAMRRELEYIEDDRAALRWAIGCVATSYTAQFVVVLRFCGRILSRPLLAAGMLVSVALA